MLVKDSHLTGRTEVGRAAIRLADIVRALAAAVSGQRGREWWGRRQTVGMASGDVLSSGNGVGEHLRQWRCTANERQKCVDKEGVGWCVLLV